MTDSTSKSIIESIASMIPGYSGYAKAEQRREQDRELRKLLAKRLGESKAAVAQKMKALQSENRFDLLKIADHLHGQLDTAQQKTLAAFEGYSGWFDKSQVDADKLQQVVENDESLVSLTDKIRQELPKNLEQVNQINAVGDLIATYQQRFDRRQELLHN